MRRKNKYDRIGRKPSELFLYGLKNKDTSRIARLLFHYNDTGYPSLMSNM